MRDNLKNGINRIFFYNPEVNRSLRHDDESNSAEATLDRVIHGAQCIELKGKVCASSGLQLDRHEPNMTFTKTDRRGQRCQAVIKTGRLDVIKLEYMVDFV